MLFFMFVLYGNETESDESILELDILGVSLPGVIAQQLITLLIQCLMRTIHVLFEKFQSIT